MKKVIPITLLAVLSFTASGQNTYQKSHNGGKIDVMSPAYREMWNAEVQQKIDHDIETYRKADAVIKLDNVKPGTQVKVEQLTSDFLFGANIFLFGQFDTPEKNKRYEDMFGTLFNAASVPFYWKTLEPEKGKLRFTADSPAIFRRPPTDPVVDFCESKGIVMKGHAIVYGIRQWGHPDWLPEDRKQMEPYFDDHVRVLAERYKDRVQSWDVVNEAIDQADRGPMPDDYTYKTYLSAMKYFPENVEFNINDCDMHDGPRPRYVELVRNLIDRGIRIDNVGVEMHIFRPSEAEEIAAGSKSLSPEKIWATLDCFSQAERPLLVSEVTITAPDDTERGKAIQAELTRDLYRLWFSYPTVKAITWWNIADGGVASDQPAPSGMLDKDCNPKPVYGVLDNLINHEWKTNITVPVEKDGTVSFRGFKGNYRLSWTDRKGNTQTMEYHVK